MTDIITRAEQVIIDHTSDDVSAGELAQALADAGLLTDGTNYAALVKEAQRSGCAVEIDGVRIHPCDTYGNDTTKPTRTVPTRGEIAVQMKRHFDRGSDGWLDMADAVLALMADQPTVTEAKAQALEEAATEIKAQTLEEVAHVLAEQEHFTKKAQGAKELKDRAQQIRDGK